MRHTVTLMILIVALAATAGGAQQLLPAAASDLSADTLTAAPRLKGLEVPREPVRSSWSVAADAALEAPTPDLSRSKEYFAEITAEDLVRGVSVYTTRPGALVRLNPSAAADRDEVGAKVAIQPASLVLIDAAGTSWAAASGMDLVVGPEQLKAAGAPFAEGTSAFRIRQELGAGAFELRAEGLGRSSARYVMHVLDRASSIELLLRTGATDYLHGQTLTVEARLADGKTSFRPREIEGFVSSPAGRAWPLSFRSAGDGLYRASLVLDALEAPAPGLWEVHARADGRVAGQAVLRAGRTAFGCAVPSARFSGAARVAAPAAGSLGVRLGVETVADGRYEARGVLYATAADGTLRPAGVAHSAAWLVAGAGVLELSFDRGLLAGGELGAPFELRDLRLADQVNMGLLHRQARALAFGD